MVDDQSTLDCEPLRVLEIELGRALPTLLAINEQTGHAYRRARCLVRLHDQPLGIVDVHFEADALTANDYAPRIWSLLHEQINAHLRQDGLPIATALHPAGLICSPTPACIEEREAFYAAAPFVSVIISTHDRPDRLSMCLPPLLSQRYPDYEVVIVDNAPSSSATFDLVHQLADDHPQLRYVREDVPGLSRGLNRGLRAARGAIVAFTDDDVVVDACWLLHLARAFSVTGNVACVTGLVMPLELETPAQILFEEYGGFNKGFRRRVYDMAAHRPDESLFPYTAGRFGTGASMAFRVDFLRMVNGFDTALQCGMDIAAFFQAIKRGYTLVYEPAALAYHGHRRGYGELQRQIYTYGVGLTAYLTKILLEQPRYLLELLTKIPYGLLFLLSTRSPKNQKKQVHYPKDLTRLEIKGMLHGPFIYVQRKNKRVSS